MQEQIDTPAIKHVIVDLGEIPYFGSTVLEWMVQMWKRIKAKGGKLADLQRLADRPRSAQPPPGSTRSGASSTPATKPSSGWRSVIVRVRVASFTVVTKST